VSAPLPQILATGATNLEPVCSCCGNARFARIIGANDPWRYFVCEECGGVQLVPVPSELQLEEFYNFAYKVEANRHLRQMSTIGTRMLDVLEAKSSGRRLLEIGCSYGGFLRLAKSRGWSCAGIEASASAATEAAKVGVEVYAGTVQTNLSRLGSRKFDVIAMWHVLEHLPDVREVLRPVCELLESGGYLTLRTPNAECVGARLLCRRWEWFYAPEHIFLYTARGIQKLLKEFHLEVESISSQRGDAQTLLSQTISALGSFATGKLREGVGKTRTGLEKRPAGLRAIHRRMSSIANIPGRPIDALLGLNGSNLRGSELVVLARKPENFSE
jgi:2-polyprenyl-3-methyl-5-hydroxy-6-metoxy-1,4-benzoquinol methylase